MTAWRDRPRADRYAVVGAFVGMAIAAPVAIVFAFDAAMISRYLIMAAGLLLGIGIGKWLGARDASKA